MQCSIIEDYKNNSSNNTNKNWIFIKIKIIYKSKKKMNENKFINHLFM